ncbi:MAG: helix-hairpin-helix domain-containing protein [Thermoguttaceae bacterium]|nr:helix-hairpin-helix domain-containing protein [Thermoguttaceae bacterium]
MTEPIIVNPVFLARELELPLDQVEATVALLEEGYPVPFIARYRKDQTKNLSEDGVAKVAAAYQKQRQLTDRKLSFLKTIEAQGKLTPELEQKIREARTARRLDDLYLPFKSKRQTLAQAAREKGLEPLADAILNAADESADLNALAAPFVDAEKGVATVEEALKGAADIIAETFAETFEVRRRLRDKIQRTGKLVSKKVEKKGAAAEPEAEAVETPVEPVAEETVETPVEANAETVENAETAAETTDAQAKDAAAKADKKKKKKTFKEQQAEQLEKQFVDYFDASFDLRSCPPHRALALNRGENAKIISVKLDVDVDHLKAIARETLVAEGRPFADFLNACADDAVVRLAAPSLEREARRELTDRAEEQAVSVFAKNLRNLLMQRPLNRRRVLALDPGFKNGCKLVALDEFGNVLDFDAVFLQGNAERRAAASAKIVEFVEKYKLSAFAIGNGTGCREAENFVAKIIEEKFADADVAYIVVNEAGASVYSTSQIAKDEFPNYDPLVRGAASIGRRLQNPLNELVKIDAERLGVGMYQHDVKSKALKDALTNVVASCVNRVGVDLNAATPAILRYVAGLNQLTAKRVYERRVANGPYRRREELKEISGLGETAFSHCAGFLKIVGGDNPLDATWIHPESYELATKILEKLGFAADDLRVPAKVAELAEAIKATDADALAEEFGAGPLAVADLLEQFVRPGLDPRDSLPGPIFKKGVLKMEDLQPGMELTGVVLNVVDFGAFVDVGLHESGLVHISQLGDSYVRDAHQKVAVGDVLKVWVLEVDPKRRRVSLTTLAPGTVRERRQDGSRRPRRDENASAGTASENGGERRPRRERDGEERRPRRDRGERAERGERGERPEGNRRGRGRDDRSERAPRVVVAAPKDKKIKPISDEMKSGKEAMRSFSDLAQFFGRVQPDADAEK